MKFKTAGFTLIELLVVIAILGILAAAIIATIDPFEQIKKAQDASVKNAAVEFTNASIRYYSTHDTLPWTANISCLNEVGTGNVLSKTPSCLSELVNNGELKASFVNATGVLNKIYISTCGNSIIVCFNPLSLSQNNSAETRYDQNGNLKQGCPESNGKSANCYWCTESCSNGNQDNQGGPGIGGGGNLSIPTSTPTPTPIPTLTPTPTPSCKNVSCYVDADGDGYGAIGSAPMVFCNSLGTCPTGYVSNDTDCCDADAKAYPGQTAWFATADKCGSFAYACSGTVTQEYPCLQPSNLTCTTTYPSSYHSGFVHSIPTCGAHDSFNIIMNGTTPTCYSHGDFGYQRCEFAEQGHSSYRSQAFMVTQACH
jgi:prepilin-type N-terminal cleavage/methylation domain-containing protein